MKKFSFRLQSVLKVRELHQKQAEREVATTQSRLQRTSEELEATVQAYAQSFQFLAPPDGNQAFWNEVNRRYQDQILRRQAELSEQKSELNERLNREKALLAERMKDTKVIEKLKENDHALHQKLFEEEIQHQMEELDLLKRGKKNGR